jgi:glycosyltransferase involved in cell wall biosynthesis
MSNRQQSTTPRVAIIIPTYNRAKLLPRAIESALVQTRADLCEIIVVNDGGSDETADVVAKYGNRVRYIEQGNLGLAGARNTGIRAAQAELLTFLDDDDIFSADKIERQVAVFDRWPEVALCAGCVAAEYPDGRTELRDAPDVVLNEPADLAGDLLQASFISVPVVMVRRSAVEAVGLFHEPLRRCEDYHLWVRLAARWPAVFLDAHLANFATATPGSLTANRAIHIDAEIKARQLLHEVTIERPELRPHWRAGLRRAYAAARDCAYREQRRPAARRHAWRAAWCDPWGLERWEWLRLIELLFSARPRQATAVRAAR